MHEVSARCEQRKAQRSSTSLTAGWERRVLPKLARGLPAWVTPDHLTLLGILAAFIIAGGYVLSHLSPLFLLVSVAGLVLHWLGDSLDGTLARVRQQERERYGYFVDRVADAIATLVILVGFGLSPYVDLTVALGLVVVYMLLQMLAEICAYTSGRFPLSFARLGPTEGRIALGLFTLVLVFWRPGVVLTLAGRGLSILDLCVVAISLMLLAFFLIAARGETRRLDRLDRARWGERPLGHGAR